MKNALLPTLLYLAGISLYAQPEITVIATGLRGPVGIDPDGQGNYLVAQQGTGQDDGEISLMRPDGQLEALVVGLPSRFDTVLQEMVGPLRAQMLQHPHFIVFAPFVPGEETPVVHLFNMDEWTAGNPLTPADALSTFHIGDYVYDTGFDNSNPYSMVHNGCDWFIADAGANAILKRNGLTGELSVIAQFPDYPNPTPIGPPFVDIVPTRIIETAFGGFFVSSLTGFPFLNGASALWLVDEINGAVTLDTGLTLVTDIVLDHDGGGILMLQFASFDLMSMPPFVPGSSQIIHASSENLRDTLVTGFGPSAGMALGADGDIYVTEVFTGRILRIDPNTTAVNPEGDPGPDALMVYPNPTSDIVSLSYHLPVRDELTLEAWDMTGRLVSSRTLGFREAGTHRETISLTSWLPASVAAQNLYLRLEGREGWSVDRLVVVVR